MQFIVNLNTAAGDIDGRISLLFTQQDLFAVPIAKWHHTITFLVITILVTLMPSERKWELYEMAFGLIFLLIFLGPVNKNIYQLN